MRIVVCPFSVNHCVFCPSFGHCFVCLSSPDGFWLPLWYLQALLIVEWHIWKGISNGLSPICSFICTRQTSLSGFQGKTMYWTLREWSMSNPRKFPHFILIRHPKWRSGNKAISSWMKLKKIKIVRIGDDTTKHICVCTYSEQIEDEVWFCLLFYLVIREKRENCKMLVSML